MREACERLGGEHGNLINPEATRQAASVGVTRSPQGRRPATLDDDRPRSIDSIGQDDVEYTKVGREQQVKERQRMGFRG